MKKHLQDIHTQAILKSNKYKNAEYELLKAIEKVHKYKVYYALECKSLSDYCVKYLNLSYDVAMTFINVMDKAQKFDELDVSLRENKITMSNARKISPILTPENQSFWIHEAEKTSENLQTKLSEAFPERIRKESVKTISDDYVSITIRVKKSDFETIKRAKEIQSKKKKRVIKFDEAIITTAKDYVEKNDPVEKANRSKAKKTQPADIKKETTDPVVTIPKTGASRPPARSIHIVNLRDHGECQKIGKDNKKCKSREFTEIHHIIPRSKGGSHDPENLITLCSGHHKAHHFFNEH
jgi:5-methylcytosine-specific restriction endonuclease McrA